MEHYSKKQKDEIKTLMSRLIDKRNKQDWTQRSLAIIFGIKSHVTIWRWLNGKSFPSQSNIYRIKRFLGLDI